MSTDADAGETTLEPDDAFAVLGNETRMAILQKLADSDGALAFSELRERVGVSDSGQFNYHLNKLVGHFIRNPDEGYTLGQAGERVIEAILSGAVTENPLIEPTHVDLQCPLCDAPVEVSYQNEWVALSCTECPGIYGESSLDDQTHVPDGMLERGYLGGLSLPPAGIHGRGPMEVLQAAEVWGTLETLATAEGICPRCSASMETSVKVCEAHDDSNGVCERCGFRSKVSYDSKCTNCPFDKRGAFTGVLSTNTEFIAFGAVHGYNPIRPTDLHAVMDVDQEVSSTNPFEARVTYSIGEDSLSLTVDDDLEVINVERG